MRTDKQIAANRLNALKSHGPANTTSTRTNATKHGLLAAGITELDDAEGYRVILQELEQETNPVGTIESFLVESIAVELVRLRRARRLEAQHINGALDPSTYKTVVRTSSMHRPQIDPGLPARLRLEHIYPLVKLFQRYEATIQSRFFRSLHEFERLNRMRQGEQLPAPAALDVSVHHDTGMQSDTMPLPQEETLGDKQGDAINHATFPEPETETPGDKEDTEIKRVSIPEPETEILGDPEIKD
jgi:hypothetical protein